MYQFSTLVEIGSIVKVDLQSLEPVRFQKDVIALLRNNPSCKVIDYKMTDGGGIGFVLRLHDGSTCWVFDYEIENPFKEDTIKTTSDQGFLIPYSRTTSSKELLNQIIPVPRRDVKSISYLLNPVNFVSWLLFSLKDVL